MKRLACSLALALLFSGSFSAAEVIDVALFGHASEPSSAASRGGA